MDLAQWGCVGGLRNGFEPLSRLVKMASGVEGNVEALLRIVVGLTGKDGCRGDGLVGICMLLFDLGLRVGILLDGLRLCRGLLDGLVLVRRSRGRGFVGVELEWPLG